MSVRTFHIFLWTSAPIVLKHWWCIQVLHNFPIFSFLFHLVLCAFPFPLTFGNIDVPIEWYMINQLWFMLSFSYNDHWCYDLAYSSYHFTIKMMIKDPKCSYFLQWVSFCYLYLQYIFQFRFHAFTSFHPFFLVSAVVQFYYLMLM